MTAPVSTAYLIEAMQDARQRTLELVRDLDDEQLMGPRLPTVNPLRWEIAHVAYFYEYFILRRLYGHDSVLGERADQLYDSIAIDHDLRWDLALLTRAETLSYLSAVLDRLVERLGGGMASEGDSFIYQFGIFHEDMHTEAFLWTRQTLAYATPDLAAAADVSAARAAGAHPGWAEIPGGAFLLGAPKDAPFLFDNEKWAHAVTLAPFEIAKAPVTNREFQAFVDDGGYGQEALWDAEGWKWRQEAGAKHPVYWRRAGPGDWLLRRFERTMVLPAHEPVVHVNWFEADAYCRWAGQRLPREVEWEAAALGEAAADGTLSAAKRRYPWGAAAPDPSRANLDGRALGPVGVAALAAGDSAFGCRQMLGNVWEWTADTFYGFPGFSADAYKEYSAMLFGDTKVLRGGAWTTRGRMIHGTYRNYFEAWRRDVFAGFRTCRAAEE
ncbi:MAG: ergothioneine biosynthesis protein EgtB [Alphaproteobacteria bacterium]|nr:MAG: ergothioneine biosynthesis protein EgtB [Alphaproteobacteria bacterium]